jgi:hypothetical protein
VIGEQAWKVMMVIIQQDHGFSGDSAEQTVRIMARLEEEERRKLAKEERRRVKEILLESEQHRYDPRYVKHFGSDAAIFLAQLVFRDGHGMNPDGWIYKSEREWEQETGLSRRRQRNARKVLLAKDVIEEQRGKEPGSGRPVNYYRLDGVRLLRILDPDLAEAEGFGFDEDYPTDDESGLANPEDIDHDLDIPF